MRLISESGLYKLVLRSDKPEAKAFQDWVTRTVLPAVRKDGAYVAGEEKLALPGHSDAKI
jgi:prophage antirepressor-like protein